MILSSQGPRAVEYDDLSTHTGRWPVTQATPAGVASLLRTAREAFALAMYRYELLVVSAVWSLMAIEAGLREFYDEERKELVKLIRRAGQDGLITPEWVMRLDAGRKLRNSLIHSRGGDAWTPGMAGPVVDASHQVIARLYPDLHRERPNIVKSPPAP